MYSIKQVADVSGVSIRTLRYYDEIGLLAPNEVTAAGYRQYTDKELDRLQLILFYRELELPLKEIQALLDDHQDPLQILEQQRQQLVAKQQRLTGLIETIEHTISTKKGEDKMSNDEKFASFKRAQVTENEQAYGDEIRQRYGNEAVESANEQWQGLTKDQYDQMQTLEQQLFTDLRTYVADGETDTKLAQRIFETHRDWLKITWPKYSATAHRGLGDLYANDSRFASYYDDRAGAHAASALTKIIYEYTK
ncbi:MerR family transcriptional regulator [Furfurilactobacillus siliginis]|uniref:MerR family transcriptional regulator n=1 Tax=Furfurilactobacillus siliginis TaxID=348151 RepID=A0A0R2LF74_9LACO|nr:MerR family transcriptional regulator [Furfurilactobacillus siliginis]KRN97213.1 MerR family transcriptional regulator [Furfurilactobacillus siliginis]GEK29314.1 MerR family transcriptional regulator [Furfurilactobacillus siliginis]